MIGRSRFKRDIGPKRPQVVLPAQAVDLNDDLIVQTDQRLDTLTGPRFLVQWL
jgi:hypothetical protein